MKQWLVVICSFLILSWVAFTPQAYAYIDPGTASMVLQALLAALFAVILFGKNIFYRISGLFHPKSPTEEASTAREQDGSSSS